jgi:hypothetical protein
MGYLIGLPDTAGKRDCQIVRSVSAALSAIRDGEAATAAGDRGSINVWVDDKGRYRCEAMRYMATVNSETPKNLKELKAWLSEWLPWTLSENDET